MINSPSVQSKTPNTAVSYARRSRNSFSGSIKKSTILALPSPSDPNERIHWPLLALKTLSSVSVEVKRYLQSKKLFKGSMHTFHPSKIKISE